MPQRPDFWGLPHPWGPILVYSVLGLAFAALLVRLYRRGGTWFEAGLPEKRSGRVPGRLGRVVLNAILQLGILRQKFPGVMHLCLVLSIFIFFLGTVLASLHSHVYPILAGSVFLAYKTTLNLAILLFTAGLGMALFRRCLKRPPHLSSDPRFTWVLILLALSVYEGAFLESFHLAIEQPEWGGLATVDWALARTWLALEVPLASLQTWHGILYGLHVITVAVILVTFPSSPLLHILTTTLTVYFTDPDQPLGRLAPQPRNCNGEPAMGNSISSLPWFQLLEADACTECGRCQSACPAFAAGLPLDPRQVLLGIRDGLDERIPGRRPWPKRGQALAGGTVAADTLWSCYACGACVTVCPVLINPLDAIVNMRRILVNEGWLDPHLQTTLERIQVSGSAFEQNSRQPQAWLEGILPPLKDARTSAIDILWFVGDTAAHDPLAVTITKTTAKLFNLAGLDVGILFDSEWNAGNDVRRVGEEGLFEELVRHNSAILEKCTFSRIVTTDPHTYNTLKNEYPPNVFNGRPILHYSELLEQLLASGRLNVQKEPALTVTFHDPCYLGRFNGVYEPPRRVIAATGCRLVEMPRRRAASFCCGAGGGSIWMEEGAIRERPAENRLLEAKALQGVSRFIVACPKDYIMYTDAARSLGLEGVLKVQDLAELVAEALQ